MNNNNSNGNMNDNSFSELFNSFNDVSSADNNINSNHDGDIGNLNNANNKRFLETQVQPVHRQSESYNDDELFKFFDMDDDDGSGPDDMTGKKSSDMVSWFLMNASCQLLPRKEY